MTAAMPTTTAPQRAPPRAVHAALELGRPGVAPVKEEQERSVPNNTSPSLQAIDTLFLQLLPAARRLQQPDKPPTRRHGSSSCYPSPAPEHDYLIGVRGVLVVMSFIWCFLSVFAPTAVKDTGVTDGPFYQSILRKVLSVLFWNQSLIYSSIVLLSARTICVPFLKNPVRQVVASQLFRRGIRLWIPTTVSFGLAALILNQIGTGYIDDFKTSTGHTNVATPEDLPNFLNFFNSLFEIFWVVHDFAKQKASLAYPSQTLWIVSLVFLQSYTVYMSMICIPYTRNSWRVKAFVLYIITAWWVQSWAWYSATGLLFADVVINMDFKAKARRGLKLTFPFLGSYRCPTWAIAAPIALAGFIMEYLWVAWRPSFANNELRAHTGLYTTGGLNDDADLTQPQARDDNYLIIVAFMIMLETYEVVQNIFKQPVFMYLGRRSFSYFLIQAIIIYTAGIKLFMHLSQDLNWPTGGSNILCLFVCLVTVIPGAEIFYRVVDLPAQVIAQLAWNFIIE
ncbi:hypothetical protein IWZ00DRAFT_563074 [Phyllosticta capitalensis]